MRVDYGRRFGLLQIFNGIILTHTKIHIIFNYF